MDIAVRIQKIIEQNNLNPYSFSVRVGTSDTVIRNILNGRNHPGFELINKIVQTFDGINVRWLITGEGEISGETTNKPKHIEDWIAEIDARVKVLERKARPITTMPTQKFTKKGESVSPDKLEKGKKLEGK